MTNEINIVGVLLRRPEMILFDYGHTLLHEPDWNPRRGIEALMRYAVRNDHGYTAEQIYTVAKEFYRDHLQPMKNLGYDVTSKAAADMLFGHLGIEFSLHHEEAETVYWNAETPGAIMPEADRLLSYLKRRGIRTGVISNLSMSSEGLARRINRFMPDNNIEFVMTSSDYVLRKPNRMLFELALHKAGLSADKVWYCGDNPHADVEGASGAGIFPVWFDSDIECPYRDKERETVPSCDMLRIKNYGQLIEILDRFKD